MALPGPNAWKAAAKARRQEDSINVVDNKIILNIFERGGGFQIKRIARLDECLKNPLLGF